MMAKTWKHRANVQIASCYSNQPIKVSYSLDWPNWELLEAAGAYLYQLRHYDAKQAIP